MEKVLSSGGEPQRSDVALNVGEAPAVAMISQGPQNSEVGLMEGHLK